MVLRSSGVSLAVNGSMLGNKHFQILTDMGNLLRRAAYRRLILHRQIAPLPGSTGYELNRFDTVRVYNLPLFQSSRAGLDNTDLDGEEHGCGKQEGPTHTHAYLCRPHHERNPDLTTP